MCARKSRAHTGANFDEIDPGRISVRQCFLTGVPWIFISCAAESSIILKGYLKALNFHHFGLFTIGCAANF